ncbi:hypothetical protein FGO68_gene2758 [Halteria grandinella]|uniref:Uncharacterized protein n=1 Tax=Halteria grandinella TaxID=5974 RepID=A0A8J8NEY5_HALGN|nr:hypothetical protein FGO68_gene2758 [Halteria grandinella]
MKPREPNMLKKHIKNISCITDESLPQLKLLTVVKRQNDSSHQVSKVVTTLNQEEDEMLNNNNMVYSLSKDLSSIREKTSFYVTHKEALSSDFGPLKSSERYSLKQRTPQLDRRVIEDRRGPKLEVAESHPRPIGLSARGKKKKRRVEREETKQSGDCL